MAARRGSAHSVRMSLLSLVSGVVDMFVGGCFDILLWS